MMTERGVSAAHPGFLEAMDREWRASREARAWTVARNGPYCAAKSVRKSFQAALQAAVYSSWATSRACIAERTSGGWYLFTFLVLLTFCQLCTQMRSCIVRHANHVNVCRLQLPL